MAGTLSPAERKKEAAKAREKAGFLARILGLDTGVGGRAIKKKKKREKGTLAETLTNGKRK